jgi:Putative restriction endonuclease
MSVQFKKHCFNVSEYDRMAEVGLLSEDSRVELIEGEIIEMSPIGSIHGGAVKRSSAFLNRKLGDAAIASVQDPIRLNDFSEPQPDLALLKPRRDFYSDSHPTPQDVVSHRGNRRFRGLRSQRETAPLCAREYSRSLVDVAEQAHHRGSLAAKEREVPKGPTIEARDATGFPDSPRRYLRS